MNHSTKKPFSIPAGTIIAGKWHKNNYLISSELGRGANGTVYLAKSIFGTTALKFSEDTTVVASEVNVLKSLSNTAPSQPPIFSQAGPPLGPSLLDVDDFEHSGKVVPFYAMEYIQGTAFLDHVRKNGRETVIPLVVELLTNLAQLHQADWVFGDLKPDNLIVARSGQLRCVDVGGTTKAGRAIKEFTDYFDRGYWGMGDRKADPNYDLFAVAMIIINAFQGKKQTKKVGGLGQLQEIITQHPETNQLKPVLIRALTGGYHSAVEMKQDLLRVAKNPIVVKKKKSVAPLIIHTNNNYFEAIFLIALAVLVYLIFKLYV